MQVGGFHGAVLSEMGSQNMCSGNFPEMIVVDPATILGELRHLGAVANGLSYEVSLSRAAAEVVRACLASTAVQDEVAALVGCVAATPAKASSGSAAVAVTAAAAADRPLSQNLLKNKSRTTCDWGVALAGCHVSPKKR